MAIPGADHPSTPAEHLFVSYAREQMALVHALGETLRTAGYSTWTDVKGLYGGETFWPEIEKALDAAAAVIFVITPESVASPHCLHELGYALNTEKRIVPVCVEKIRRPRVCRLVWHRSNRIFCRDITEIPRATREIVAAVAEDWRWLRRQHARLLARAREWRDSGREPSRLLRGSELKNAEEWTTRRPQGREQPTAQHANFLAASRAAQSRRFRRASLIALIGAGAIIVVSGVAWIQQIGKLNDLTVAALEKEESDETNASSLDNARRAVTMCSWVPLRTAACTHAGEILGVALQATYRFDESVNVFSQAIAQLSSVGATDSAQGLMLADLLWHQSVSRIYKAESQDDDRERRNEYAAAKVDFDRAQQIFDRRPKDAFGRALHTTAARFSIQAGDYAQAAVDLSNETKYAPESKLLLHLVLVCTGQPRESIKAINDFLVDTNGGYSSPVYHRNERFITRVRKACQSQPVHAASSAHS